MLSCANQQLRDAIPDVMGTIKKNAIAGERIEWTNLYLSLCGGAAAVAGANATMNVRAGQMTDAEATAILERAGILLPTLSLPRMGTEH